MGPSSVKMANGASIESIHPRGFLITTCGSAILYLFGRKVIHFMIEINFVSESPPHLMSSFLLEWDRNHVLPNDMYIDCEGKIRGNGGKETYYFGGKPFISLAGGNNPNGKAYFALNVEGEVYNGFDGMQIDLKVGPIKNIWSHTFQDHIILVARTFDHHVYLWTHNSFNLIDIPIRVAAFSCGKERHFWFINEESGALWEGVLDKPWNFNMKKYTAHCLYHIPLDNCVKFFVYGNTQFYYLTKKGDVIWLKKKEETYPQYYHIFDLTSAYSRGTMIMMNQEGTRLYKVTGSGMKYFSHKRKPIRELIPDDDGLPFVVLHNGHFRTIDKRYYHVNNPPVPPSFRYRVRFFTQQIHAIRGSPRNIYWPCGLPKEIWHHIFEIIKKEWVLTYSSQ